MGVKFPGYHSKLLGQQAPEKGEGLVGRSGEERPLLVSGSPVCQGSFV